MSDEKNKKKGLERTGYHIRPKYDLRGVRKRLQGAAKKKSDPQLSLVSLIDMFSIIVIYLIINYSATGEIYFVQKDLKLPFAENGRPLESAPLVSITEKEVSLDAEVVGDNPIVITLGNYAMPRLKQALRHIRNLEERTHPNREFEGNINIQASEDIPLIFIKRVMTACIEEGWTGIHFATRLDE